MGQPKFPRKKYDTPLHPWKEERINQERELMKKYGLKNHKEVWRAKTYLGRYRHQARELLARIGSRDPQIKREGEQLLFHLTRMGILPLGGSLDDVLALEIETVLSRRLQTLVYLKGFSSTAHQSRQLINHGHIHINERKVTIPGYLVTKDEEEFIGYTTASPLNEISHPARPKSDMPRVEPPQPSPEKTPSTKPPASPKETEKPAVSPKIPTETEPAAPEKTHKEEPKKAGKPGETAQKPAAPEPPTEKKKEEKTKKAKEDKPQAESTPSKSPITEEPTEKKPEAEKTKKESSKKETTESTDKKEAK
jgi:small subunit ribosomal protein S4